MRYWSEPPRRSGADGLKRTGLLPILMAKEDRLSAFPLGCCSQFQLAESEMAEKIDVEVTGKSQFEVAYDMARFILINMEGRRVKSVKRHEFLHLVADCTEALRGIKVREIIS
jgi:hypothetical protein